MRARKRTHLIGVERKKCDYIALLWRSRRLCDDFWWKLLSRRVDNGSETCEQREVGITFRGRYQRDVVRSNPVVIDLLFQQLRLIVTQRHSDESLGLFRVRLLGLLQDEDEDALLSEL
jgi:hypothetical protein